MPIGKIIHDSAVTSSSSGSPVRTRFTRMTRNSPVLEGPASFWCQKVIRDITMAKRTNTIDMFQEKNMYAQCTE